MEPENWLGTPDSLLIKFYRIQQLGYHPSADPAYKVAPEIAAAPGTGDFETMWGWVGANLVHSLWWNEQHQLGPSRTKAEWEDTIQGVANCLPKSPFAVSKGVRSSLAQFTGRCYNLCFLLFSVRPDAGCWPFLFLAAINVGVFYANISHSWDCISPLFDSSWLFAKLSESILGKWEDSTMWWDRHTYK